MVHILNNEIIFLMFWNAFLSELVRRSLFMSRISCSVDQTCDSQESRLAPLHLSVLEATDGPKRAFYLFIQPCFLPAVCSGVWNPVWRVTWLLFIVSVIWIFMRENVFNVIRCKSQNADHALHKNAWSWFSFSTRSRFSVFFHSSSPPLFDFMSFDSLLKLWPHSCIAVDPSIHFHFMLSKAKPFAVSAGH